MNLASIKRPAFLDPLLQEEFNANGYVVVDLADPNELQLILDTYYQLYPDEQEGCVFSSNDLDLNRRLPAQALLRKTIETKASTFLREYQFVCGSFVVKHPGEKSFVEPHIDYTFVENQLYSAIAVWFPLTDLASDSGRLHVLPGSHLNTPICGSNIFKRYPNISISQMRELHPKIGQAVCYDVQLIHASPANQSMRARIAANCVFTPKEAQLLHVTQRDEIIYRYAVDLEFYASRGGDENANQTLLHRYSVLDSHSSAFDQDHLITDSSNDKSPRPPDVVEWLINRGASFCNRWI